MMRIAKGLRERYPDVPVIAFPRAVGPAMLMYRRPEDFLRAVDRYRHRRALGGQGTAAAYLPAGQSRSDHAGGRRPGDGARGDAHPRQARTRIRSCSISATVSCRRRRPITWRGWSRSCATGSRARAHENRDHPVQSRRAGLARGGAAVPAQSFQRSRDHLRVPGFCAGRWRGFIASRRAPKAQKIYDQIGGARRSSARPKRRRARWKRRLARSERRMARLSSACATGIR